MVVHLLVLVHVEAVNLLVILDVKVMGGSCFKGYNPCGSCASCTGYSYG